MVARERRHNPRIQPTALRSRFALAPRSGLSASRWLATTGVGVRTMSGVLQKIIERTWAFLLVVGLAVLLIGASGGIQSQSVSIVIPEIGWRVLVSLVGIILFFVGLLQVLQESKLTQKTEKIRMFLCVIK